MANKFVVVVLAALTVVAVSAEKEKRQSGTPDLNELFNKFQEQIKPIQGMFPQIPNLGSFPGLGGSAGFPSGGSLYKRQIDPNTMTEWFNKFQETGNNFVGNLPFKPPSFGQFPFPGSSSSSEPNESS